MLLAKVVLNHIFAYHTFTYKVPKKRSNLRCTDGEMRINYEKNQNLSFDNIDIIQIGIIPGVLLLLVHSTQVPIPMHC